MTYGLNFLIRNQLIHKMKLNRKLAEYSTITTDMFLKIAGCGIIDVQTFNRAMHVLLIVKYIFTN
jgi:hypothetical protein